MKKKNSVSGLFFVFFFMWGLLVGFFVASNRLATSEKNKPRAGDCYLYYGLTYKIVAIGEYSYRIWAGKYNESIVLKNIGNYPLTTSKNSAILILDT